MQIDSNNPYVKKSHRQSLKQQSRNFLDTPRPDRLLMREVARATGVRVIEEERPLYLDYSLPVPCKANDNEAFDDVVRRDRNWLAGRNRRIERN